MATKYLFLLSLDEAKIFLEECVNNVLQTQQSTSTVVEAPEPLIQIDEVCQIFNISKPTVHEWKRSGKIPFYRVGRRIYFKRSEIMYALQDVKKRRVGR